MSNQFIYTGDLNINNINFNGAGTFNLNSGTITNAALPISAGDLASKSYVDAVAQGLGPKLAVSLKTTAANLAALSGNYTAFGSGAGKYLEANANGTIPNIDSTAVVIGMRILFAHSAPSDADYGIYDVTSVGSAGSKWRLTRSADADNNPTTGEMVTGVYTLVQSGTVHAQQGWCLVTTGTITIDVTAQTWSQITAAAAGATSLDGLSDASTTGGSNNLAVGTNFTFVVGATDNVVIAPVWNNVTIASGAIQNVFVGNNAGGGLSTGFGNTLVGHSAGGSISSGLNNTIVGKGSGIAITTSTGSLILGAQSGTSMTGGFNTIVGYSAGTSLTSGTSNIIVGYNSNVSNGTFSNCVVIGDGASGSVNGGLFFRTALAGLANGSTTSKIVIFNTTTGQMGGIADGTNGQVLTTNGSGTLTWSTVGGGGSLDSLSDASTTGGANNLAVGNNTTFSGASSSNTILSKSWTGASVTSASNNLIAGYNNGDSITTATSNVILGVNNTSLTSGNSNIIIGPSAMGALSTGSSNVFIGSGISAGIARASAIAIGNGASATVDNGLFYPTALAGLANGSTTSKIVIFNTTTGQMGGIADGTNGQVLTTNGSGTLTWSSAGGGGSLDGLSDASTTGGTANIALGTNFTFSGLVSNNIVISSGWTNTTLASPASNNLIVGNSSASAMTIAVNNTLLGHNVCPIIVDGSNNTVSGKSSGLLLVDGASNSIYGSLCGNAISSGSLNVIMGYSAGNTITTGSRNVIIGNTADVNAGSVGNAIAIGFGAVATTNSGLFYPTTLAGLANGSTTSKIVIFNSTSGQMGGIADGTNGQVLTTNGSGTLTWSTAGGATAIDGLSDASTTGGTNNLAVGTNFTFPGTSNNNFVVSRTWTGAGMVSASIRNIVFGNGSANTLTSGTDNLVFGNNSGTAITSGGGNIIIGNGTSTVLSTGSGNLLFNGADVDVGGRFGTIGFGSVTCNVDNGLFFNTNLASLSNGSTTSQIMIFNNTTGQMGGIADGSASQALMTNGAGTLTWGNVPSALTDLSDVKIVNGTDNFALGSNFTFPGATSNNLIISRTFTGAGVIAGFVANTIIGGGSGNSMTSAGNNTIVGQASGTLITTGSTNIIVGDAAGQNIVAGSGNILIGSQATTVGDYSGCVVLGTAVSATTSNAIFVTTTVANNTIAGNPTDNFAAVFDSNIGRIAPCAKDADVGAITDSTTGTAGSAPYTLNNVTSNAISNDNFAKLAAELNAIRTCLRNHGLML